MTAFRRQPAQFADKLFDVLVIGGGINGAGIAWDAALRGLKVALVEKSDFSGGASSGCFKIVHGGLRYLQHFDISRLRKSVREQRILRHIAGSLVKPLPFLVPCYGSGKKGRGFLWLGLTVYELLSLDRNRHIRAERQLPHHSVLSTSEVLERAPGLRRENLRGGVIFYDAQMRSAERLTLAVARSAAEAGATVANYLELQNVDKNAGGEWRGLLKDNLSGASVPFRARAIVNAAGPWTSEVLGRLNVTPHIKRSYVRGVQFVFPPMLSGFAVAIESTGVDRASVVRRGGRSYFLVPWEGFTLAGTYEMPTKDVQDPFRVEPAEQDQFLEELRSSYNDTRLSRENIVSVFGGLIPLDRRSVAGSPEYAVERTDEIRRLSHEKILINVLGVKYTTFRSLSEKVVDRLVENLGGRFDRCRTEEIVLTGTEEAALEYHAGMLESQLSRSITEEMVCRVNDFIFRRLPLAAQGIATPDMIDVLSAAMGAELGWSPARLAAEREEARKALFTTCPESYKALRMRESVGA